MPKTHTLKPGSLLNAAEVTKPITPVHIPAPDLLDLVRTHLPGDIGTSAMYSICGSLSIRIARLAGMVASGLAADLRSSDTTIDSFNDAMSFLDEINAAAITFEEAGIERRPMIQNLRELISFKHAADDYLMTLVTAAGMRKTDWKSSIELAGEPMPVDKWMLDMQWDKYIAQTNNKPVMTRTQYDAMTQVQFGGQRAQWLKHVHSVENIIELADTGYAIEFDALDVRTQLSLLNSYATAARLTKFEASCYKRAMMLRTGPMQYAADVAMHKSFVDACELATHHKRYANQGEQLVARPEPHPAKAPVLRKDKSPVANYVEQVAKSVDEQTKLDQAAAAKKRKSRAKADTLKTVKEAIQAEPLTLKQEHAAIAVALTASVGVAPDLATIPNDL